MKPLAALTSVMTTAAFHASASGEILEVNAPFVQLMRCVPGDDWRMYVEDSDRTLLDAFWISLFNEPDVVHQPIKFSVKGSDASYEVRGQAVSDEEGRYSSAVAVLMVESASGSNSRWEVDSSTGLPEHNAVLERFEQLQDSCAAFVAAVILLDSSDASEIERRKEAARQLLAVIRPNDMLASQADGRFLLCAPGIGTHEAALALAGRLVDSLKKSSITARVGLALPGDGMGAATLVREAEAGAYAVAEGAASFAPQEDAA